MSEKVPKAVIDVKDIKSAVLRRLVAEVRAEKSDSPARYNRIHNRHNRSR
jgi:hypothetical protein